MRSAATGYQHSWGAAGSDQAQSRWADLRQDEEWSGAPRPTACKLLTVGMVQTIISPFLWAWLCKRYLEKYTVWLFLTGCSACCVLSFCGCFYSFLCLCCRFQAYDQHLNMILGDVEETVTTVEIDEETYEELYKVQPHFLLFFSFYSCTFTPKKMK